MQHVYRIEAFVPVQTRQVLEIPTRDQADALASRNGNVHRVIAKLRRHDDSGEIENLKSRLDGIYLANDWTRLMTTVIPFSSTPAVIASFVYAPDFDFEGNYLQRFEDHSKPLDHLMITVTPANTGGYAFLSHLDYAGTAPRNLIASLLRRPNLTSALIWLLIAQSENIAMSPDWYESLSNELRSRLGSIATLNADPMNESVNVLKDCPEYIDDWKPLQVFRL